MILFFQAIDDFLTPESTAQRILPQNFVKPVTDSHPHRDTVEVLNEATPPILKSAHSHLLIQKDGSLSPGGLIMADTSPDEMRPPMSPPFVAYYTGTSSHQRSHGQKCSRRKRDLVLSVSMYSVCLGNHHICLTE